MKKTIDINCDMGESYFSSRIGDDERLMPLISSCNIATGFHGGDPATIDRTMELALKHGVRIGAHPSYPDIEGFGRRPFNCTPRELYLMIRYQLGGFMALLEQKGQKINHIKAHGQLYNDLQSNKNLSSAFISAVQEVDVSLPILGLPNSELSNICQIRMMHYIGEGFIDRLYQQNGQLTPRNKPNAVIKDPTIASHQAFSLLRNTSIQTLCIHGDNSAAFSILLHVKELFKKEDVTLKAFV